MEGSSNNDLAILSLIMAAFYFAGLYKIGIKAGLLWIVGTVLLFVFIWPLGVVAVLAIAGYGLLPSFRPLSDNHWLEDPDTQDCSRSQVALGLTGPRSSTSP
jgi:hypothetical protein